MSNHNLCFGAKVRKIGIPLHTPVLFFIIKVGYERVYISGTCFLDVLVIFVFTLCYIYRKISSSRFEDILSLC